MSDQNELEEIKKIDQNLSIINEKTSSQNEIIRVLVEKRNKLNLKTKDLRQEIIQKKIERDKLNNKVKVLKQKRNVTHLEIREKIETTKKKRKKIESLKEKIPNRSSQDLRKEFDETEWKIQTSILELEEEKELVDRVKNLGTQLSKYKQIDAQKLKIRKLSIEIYKLKQYAEKTHNELTKIANKSQELHTFISAKINEIKITKEEADQLHKSYLKIKEQYILLRNKSRELIQKKRTLLNSIKENDEKNRKESEDNLKKKIKMEAQSKIKNKEKLSWVEFKLLTESDQKNNK